MAIVVAAICLLMQPQAWAGATVDELVLQGARRTRVSTIEALLPRPLPAALTSSEVAEFERRVRNLGIFDFVRVSVVDRGLIVEVREKFTLSPVLEFSTGATLADTYVLAGATEYNLLGTASALSLVASWEQRGPNAIINYKQHPYARGRWALDVTGYFTSADFRFADLDIGWIRRQAGMDVLTHVPFAYDGSWRLALGWFALGEWSQGTAGPRAPPGGLWTGAMVISEYDRYTFHDLVPYGLRATLELVPGLLVPALTPRPEGTLTLLAAARLWHNAVLAARGKVSGVWGGNVNHSVLLGSLEGVRGLEDAFFRNRWQSFANLELRQSLMLALRWAVQVVVFADVAVFAPMSVSGATTNTRHAAGAGVGLRLVPLALTGIVLRLDLALPLEPKGSAFVQFALSQYF